MFNTVRKRLMIHFTINLHSVKFLPPWFWAINLGNPHINCLVNLTWHNIFSASHPWHSSNTEFSLKNWLPNSFQQMTLSNKWSILLFGKWKCSWVHAISMEAWWQLGCWLQVFTTLGHSQDLSVCNQWVINDQRPFLVVTLLYMVLWLLCMSLEYW